LNGNFNRFPGAERPQTALLPVVDFRATLRLTPVVDSGRAFVEWWASFDCDPPRRGELTGMLQSPFGNWLESLRDEMGRKPVRFPPECSETGVYRP
jgi:hypothetical protein